MNFEEYTSLQVLCVFLGLLGLLEFSCSDNPRSKFIGVAWFIIWSIVPLIRFWLYSMFRISI